MLWHLVCVVCGNVNMYNCGVVRGNNGGGGGISHCKNNQDLNG